MQSSPRKRYSRTRENQRQTRAYAEGREKGPARPTDLPDLARLVAAYAPHDGSFALGIPGVHATRYSKVNKNCVHALRVPSLCIVAQGAKTTIVADEVFEYNAS